MTKHACNEIASLLSPFLDGELTDSARTQVMAHLAECPACGAQLHEIRRGRELARAMPESAVPTDLRSAILRRAGHRDVVEPAPRARLFWAQHRLLGGLAVAAPLLLVTIAGWQTFRTPEAPSQYAARTPHGAVPLPLEQLAEQVRSPERLRAFADSYQLREVSLEHALNQTSFKVLCPIELRHGRGPESLRPRELRECPLVHLSYLRGEHRILVLEQEAGWPVVYGATPVETVTIAGQECERLRRAEREIIKWERGGIRRIVVASAGNPETEKVVAALISTRS